MSLPSAMTLGIDFGTSNSVVAVREGEGAPRLLTLEGASTALPTAVFFNTEAHTTHFGRDAIAQYLAGTEGRLMRSLKSLLGSALLQDKTAVHGTLVSYQDIIALFLRHLAGMARTQLGALPQQVVMGRPVHFVDDDAERDAQAEEALRHAARQAGFASIVFQAEPIAAALDYEQRVTQETRVLVVDIGGGTSDFTVVRLGPARRGQRDRRGDVLATGGVHIGGTDFDRRLNLAHAMPLLGLGHIGPRGREVPNRVFMDLATWHLIPWRYLPAALRESQSLRTDYTDPQLHQRLMTVLNERWGHRLADAVEQGKIAVSQQGDAVPLDLAWIERGLGADMAPESLAGHLHPLLRQVAQSALDCVRDAGLAEAGVDAIYLTGGSSALQALRAVLRDAFPAVPQIEGDLFGGVAAGLACTRL